MNVLLLYPEFPDTFLGFRHALTFIRKKVGVTVVAGMLQTPPGTKLHKRLRQENRVLGQISWHCFALSTTWES